MRGYERRQVDEHLSRLAAEAASQRALVADLERRRRVAEDHATATEAEIRDMRAKQMYSPDTAPEDSFGYRAEKLLRMAEHEAADVRAKTARESANLIEHARAGAEKHRHEVEETLITRAAMLDQQIAQRAAELQDREQQIADQLAAARSEAEALHGAAARAADQLGADAKAKADEILTRAEHGAQRLRDQAAHDLQRLNALHGEVRSELQRLQELLSTELSAAVNGAVGAGRGVVAVEAASIPGSRAPGGPVAATERPQLESTGNTRV